MSDKTADMLAEDCQSNYACQFHHSGFCGYCSAKLKKAAQKINRQGIEIADHKKWDDLQAQQIEDLTREVARLRDYIGERAIAKDPTEQRRRCTDINCTVQFSHDAH